MFSLRRAIEQNDYNLVKELLHREEIHVDSVDHDGITPLHVAVKNGYEKIVFLLLEQKANIDMDSYKCETPLFLAIVNRHNNIVNILLDKGADIHQRVLGYTPLHFAVKTGNISTIKMLLQHGANINLKDAKNGYTPLHLAVIFGSENALSNCPEDNQHKTELYIDIIMYLLENEADINARNWDEESPAHCAARCNQISIVKILIENGADVNIESSDGDTPMDLMTEKNCYELIKYSALYNDFIKTNHVDYFQFWVNCKNEIDQLKLLDFNNSTISWYKFLTETNDICLESYLCNGNIRRELETLEYKITFPIYRSLVEEQFIKGRRRRCCMETIMNYFYVNLPVEDCWRCIFNYLSTREMEKFVNALST